MRCDQELFGNYVRNRGIIGKAGSLTLDMTLHFFSQKLLGRWSRLTPPPAQRSIILI